MNHLYEIYDVRGKGGAFPKTCWRFTSDARNRNTTQHESG